MPILIKSNVNLGEIERREVFNFDYSIYNNNKAEFEQNFIDKYFNYPLADYSLTEFRRKFAYTIRMKNPRYKELQRLKLVELDPLNQFSLVDRYERFNEAIRTSTATASQDSNSTTKGSAKGSSDASTDSEGNSLNTSEDFDLNQDTPTIRAEDYENYSEYASAVSKSKAKSDSIAKNKAKSKNKSEQDSEAKSKSLNLSQMSDIMNNEFKENFVKTQEGMKELPVDYIVKIKESFIDIDVLFLDEFSNLFNISMGTYRSTIGGMRWKHI